MPSHSTRSCKPPGLRTTLQRVETYVWSTLFGHSQWQGLPSHHEVRRYHRTPREVASPRRHQRLEAGRRGGVRRRRRKRVQQKDVRRSEAPGHHLTRASSIQHVAFSMASSRAAIWCRWQSALVFSSCVQLLCSALVFGSCVRLLCSALVSSDDTQDPL